MNVGELWVIEAKLQNPNISLQEIKSLWFEAKEIVKNLSNPTHYELEVSIDIFNAGIERVGDFFGGWIVGKIQPTDEELDLLEEAFNEASWAFNFLAKDSDICSPENNEGWQKKIKENKQFVSEEKNRRKQIKDLQAQINSLQNQSNNNDNEGEVNNLQKQIEILENKKPNSSSLPNLNVPQKSNSSPSKSNNDNIYSIGIFCLGFGACMILMLIWKGYQKFSRRIKS